jgi:hypothetical protein
LKNGNSSKKEEESNGKLNYKEKDNKVRKNNRKTYNFWAVQVFFLTFALALAFSVISEVLLSQSNLFIAILLLIILIIISILFDIISIAVTSCSEEPFLSMAAKKIRGAKIAVKLIKNAEKVNNICSDVIGDICGIVTGALGASIVLTIFAKGGFGADTAIISILFSSIIAAFTVGGKAVGKKFAIDNSQQIIYFIARLLSIFQRKNKS